jgi:hypothetical protein
MKQSALRLLKVKKPENKLFGTINERSFLTYTVYS